MSKINMIGKKFGKLTVLEECEERKERRIVYKCKCDCGNISYVIGKNLRNGTTKSCGCLRRESYNIKHGKRNTTLYNVWCGMKYRCTNKNRYDYNSYGGRGIEVCKEWLNDFQTFYDWAISNGYKKGLEVDRIDVNGNYEPCNCRLITHRDNCNNKRNNVYITFNGNTKTMSQWSEELNIPYASIKDRHLRGWSDKECLFGKEVK